MATTQSQAVSIDPSCMSSQSIPDDAQQFNSPDYQVSGSSTKASSAGSPLPSPSEYSYARSQSHRSNRLSLSFPIASKKCSIDTVLDSYSPTITPYKPTTPAHVLHSPNDPNSFLVALAGQERYVLELREELSKAETELKRLKNKYACHEASRKKREVKNTELLRTIKIPGSEYGETENLTSTSRPNSDADNRKVLLENTKIPKDSRRVFSGSHTRTLSLLSPERSNFNQSRQEVPSLVSEPIETLRSPKSVSPSTSDKIQCPGYSYNHVKNLYSPKNVASGAKQLVELAEDVREGLKVGVWSFLEDLRQVTVGEESINGAPTSGKPSVESVDYDAHNCSKTSTGDCHNAKVSATNRTTSLRSWENLIGNSLPTQRYSKVKSFKNSNIKGKESKSLSLTIPPADENDDPWSMWDLSDGKSTRWSGTTATSDLIVPPDSGYFDENAKITDQQLKDTIVCQKPENPGWSTVKNFSSSRLKGELQKTWSLILKEIELSTTS